MVLAALMDPIKVNTVELLNKRQSIQVLALLLLLWSTCG